MDPAHTPGTREYQQLDDESWHYLGQSWARTQEQWDPSRPARYHRRMIPFAQKVAATIVVLVVACLLASGVHWLFLLLALLVLPLWL